MTAPRLRLADEADPPDPDAPTPFQRGDDAELARATLRFIAGEKGRPLTHDNGEFWGYVAHRGIWEHLPLEQVENVAAGFAGSPVGPNGVLKITKSRVQGAAYLARTRLLAEPHVTFATAKRGVAFSDGFAVVEEGEVRLLAHDPAHGARHGFDCPYDPEAPTLLLGEFFDVLFGDCNEEERAARTCVVQEFIGACLVGEATRWQRALYLYGTGGNGKSELLSVLKGIFPVGGWATLPPQRWGERFALAALDGKLANFVDEMPEGEVTSGESFKSVISGGDVTGERKMRDVFGFKPVAGHVFLANSPLTTADQSEGFWRRPLVLPLTRRLDVLPFRRPGGEVAAEILREERAGVVAWALAGAARVQRQRAYSTSEESDKIAREWRDESDQVRMFLLDAGTWAEVPPSGWGAARFYEMYRAWATKNGHRQPVTQTTFGRRAGGSGLVDRVGSDSGRVYRRRA